jgi:hypothetical protein
MKEDVTWLIEWSSNWDWSSWLEKQYREEVEPLMANTNDWMTLVFGPLIQAAIPELIKQIPLIIQSLIEAFKAMAPEARGEVLAAAARLINPKV